MLLNKRYFNILASCMVLVFTSSCSDFLKGKPEKPQPIEVDSAAVACFKQLSPELKKIIEATATTQTSEGVFLCLDNTLTYFQQKVEGKKNPDAFTADELFTIFDKFLKDTKLSKKSTQGILLLKKALLGGSPDVLLKSEINDLKSYLVSVKTEVHLLLPHMSIYHFKKEKGPFSSEQLKAAFTQLKTSFKNLLYASKIAKSEYELEDLRALLEDLEILTDQQKNLLKIAEKAKNVLVGTEPLKSQQEYATAVDNLFDIGHIYARVFYEDVTFGIKNEAQLNKAVALVEDILTSLESSLQYQKNHSLDLHQVDSLIQELTEQKVLPFAVSKDTLVNFYKLILIKVFSENKNLSAGSLEQLRGEHLRALKKELALFKVYLSFINSNSFTSSAERKKLGDIQSSLKFYLPQTHVESFKGLSAQDMQFVLNGFNDLKVQFLSERPVVYRFNKMVIALNQDIWDQTWQDLVRGLFGNMLGRELIRGWGNGALITEAGLINWYNDFKDFAVAIKLFDSKSEASKAGKDTFLQANLFTYAGNGDHEMSQTESFQFVNQLLSGGGQIVSEMTVGLQKAGCNLKELDSFENPWNNEECFTEDFKNNYKYYFSNLSYFVGFLDKKLESKNPKLYKSYINQLLSVARRKGNSVGKLETFELRNLAMTLMYIESLFAVYDKDQNWQFSAQEIRMAYPRFRNFVNGYAHENAQAQLDEWDQFLNPCRSLYPLDRFIQEAFIFLVYNGRLPVKADINDPMDNLIECGKAKFGMESAYQPFNFSGEVDRQTIINTFQVLKSALDSK